MKRILVLALLIVCAIPSLSQIKGVAPKTETELPKPGYNMIEYLNSHIKYPPNALKKGIEGKVLTQFMVNVDGSISDVKVVRKVNKDLDAEAIRVIKSMPPWKPGTKNGKPVRVNYTQPITFRLKD